MKADATTIRLAQVSERDALERLQRGYSVHGPLYRARLAAHPDATDLPVEQIATASGADSWRTRSGLRLSAARREST